MFTLRPSRRGDIDRNFEIWQSAVLATHHFLAPEDRQEIAILVRDVYLPSTELLVAADQRDVPHAFMGTSGDHVDALFVHADSRGGGLGRLLMRSFMENREIVTVDVNEANNAACGFYERMGFTVCGRSAVDDGGRPYPLLHLRWQRP